MVYIGTEGKSLVKTSLSQQQQQPNETVGSVAPSTDGVDDVLQQRTRQGMKHNKTLDDGCVSAFALPD
jgi:hypothetical protein